MTVLASLASFLIILPTSVGFLGLALSPFIVLGAAFFGGLTYLTRFLLVGRNFNHDKNMDSQNKEETVYKDQKWFEFNGFTPSEFTRSLVQSKFTALHEQAPYGAIMKVTLTKQSRNFKGKVTISSPAGRFVAVASGTKIKEVNNNLDRQIKRQLGRWHATRFQKKTLRDVNFHGGPSFGNKAIS